MPTVRRLEGVKLHPSVGENGVRLFDEAEVHALAERMRAEKGEPPTEGQIAARVFRLFAARKDIGDIVIETELEPSVVRKLYGEWQTSLYESGHAARTSREIAEAEEALMRKFDAALRRSDG